MNKSGKMPSLRRVNVMYALLHIAYWAVFASFTAFQTALLLERGFTSSEAGICASVRCLAGIVAQPLLGRWADRHPAVSYNRILNVCLTAGLVISIGFCLARPSFLGTVLILLALGALELNVYPILDCMAVQFINTGMDVNYSLGRGLGSVSYALSCVILGRQADVLGLESVLVTHAVLLAIMIVIVALYPVPPQTIRSQQEQPEKGNSGSMWALLRGNPSFALMLGAVFFGLMAVLPVVSFLINVVEELGGGSSELGLALFLMAAAELPGAYVFRLLRRRAGSRGLLAASVGFMAVKSVLILLSPNLIWLLAVQPIQMLGYGLFTPASVYYANENVPDASRAQGQSLMMVASNGLGGVVGNLLGGWAMDLGGTQAMLLTSIACGVVGTVLAAASMMVANRGTARGEPA
jgi:PPP family 3-phenylpropionic acid transporter